jgi:hypothetical protein
LNLAVSKVGQPKPSRPVSDQYRRFQPLAVLKFKQDLVASLLGRFGPKLRPSSGAGQQVKNPLRIAFKF